VSCTVFNVVHAHDLHKYKAFHRPELDDNDKRRRKLWASEHLNESVETTFGRVFADEKTIHRYAASPFDLVCFVFLQSGNSLLLTQNTVRSYLVSL
jgi:hypothetical protein